MSRAFRVIVLISGRGSNMMSLVENAQDYEVISVISDNAQAAGLSYAKGKGIPAKAFDRSEFENRKAQRKAIFDYVQSLKPDLIALAGFMQIVDAAIVDSIYGKLINIHPALLPAYPGLHTHERALAAKDKFHGCTVHFVDSGVDTGPIIAQGKVAIEESDSEDSLAARILKIEHQIYPWCCNTIAKGELRLVDRKVNFSEKAALEAEKRGFITP